MCGRFVRFSSWAELRKTMTLLSPSETPPELSASYNVAPTQKVLVAREHDGKREGVVMRWGLIPSWAKDKKMAQITLAPTPPQPNRCSARHSRIAAA